MDSDDTVAAVAALIETTLLASDEPCEFEARLGEIGGAGFKAGVSMKQIDRMATLLGTFDEWSTVSEWLETHTYYLPEDGLRIEVCFDDDTMSVQPTAMEKRSLGTFDLATPNPLGPDVRFAASEERLVDRALPAVVQPTHVRIKQRRYFEYTPQRYHAPAFRYDLTLVWSGRTKAEAEEWQRSERPPKYEVEIELTGGRAYVEAVGSDRAARSLLAKCRDLVVV